MCSIRLAHGFWSFVLGVSYRCCVFSSFIRRLGCVLTLPPGASGFSLCYAKGVSLSLQACYVFDSPSCWQVLVTNFGLHFQFDFEKTLVLGVEARYVFDSPCAGLLFFCFKCQLSALCFFPLSFGWWDVLLCCDVVRRILTL
jgi:hypothetical protein